MSTKVEEVVISTSAVVVELTPTADGDRQHKNFKEKEKEAFFFITRCPSDQFLKGNNRYITLIHHLTYNRDSRRTCLIFTSKLYEIIFFSYCSFFLLSCKTTEQMSTMQSSILV